MTVQKRIGILRKSHGIILFDGPCNLCNKWVHFVLKRDPKAYFVFASLESKAVRDFLVKNNIDPNQNDSVVLITAESIDLRSRAVFKILRELTPFWNLFGIVRFLPPKLGDVLYDWVAKNRYRWFGKNSSCLVPEPKYRNRFIDSQNF